MRVAVVCGGDSSERAVSLQSGQSVATALRERHHRAILFDLAAIRLDDIPWSHLDGCFVALHGGAGENGEFQRQLDERGVRYTGSGPVASRLAMSKWLTKQRLLAAGLPVADGMFFGGEDQLESIATQIDQIGYPVVIKPDGQGCSLGISVAQTATDLDRCVATALQYEQTLLAERRIVGREFTVALIDRLPLPVIEICHASELFDYEVKFGDVPCEYRFPPNSVALPLQELAVQVAHAMGTSSIVRVDIMMDAAGKPFVLEVNAVPGMTARSLVPRAARAADLPMAALCDDILRRCIGQEVTV